MAKTSYFSCGGQKRFLSSHRSYIVQSRDEKYTKQHLYDTRMPTKIIYLTITYKDLVSSQKRKNNRPKTRNKNNIINEKNTHHYQPIGRNKQDWPLPACGSIYKGGLDPYCNFQVSAHQRKPTAACNLVLQTPIFMLRSTNCVARNPKFRKPSNFLQGTKITRTVIPDICHHALYRNATPRGSISVKVT